MRESGYLVSMTRSGLLTARPRTPRSGPAKGLRPSLTVCLAWLILMAGANLATPLYAVYADRFGFSSFVLTAIFATYAIVLVPALILFGRLSDRSDAARWC
jgi:MFS family permease